MKKHLRRIAVLLLEIVLTTMVLVCIDIGTNGMYLLGVPETEEVSSITVTQDGSEVTYTDSESIDLAVHLTGFCRRRLFSPIADAQPQLTILYTHSDGKVSTLSANDTTVWWNGKAYTLKNEGQMMKMAAAIFPAKGR